MSLPETFRRHALAIKWISLVVIAASLAVAARSLPLERGTEALESAIADRGVLGYGIFVGVYVVAALLFVPGSVMTLAAGAIFGLWVGIALVSLAATLVAAIAFLLSRYVLRDQVEEMASKRPKFAAIDEAISEKGWKIIGLLRLSPVIPFSISNYLFGLTKIHFLLYLAVSWAAMIPGTFMYVYLGSAGRAGASAVGGESGRSAGEWALLTVGLVATVAVTIYVTRTARAALAERSDVETESSEDDETEGPVASALVLSLIALVAIAAAVAATFFETEIKNLF